MSKNVNAADARELLRELRIHDLRDAAPGLARSVIALEAERDALREEVRSALAKYDAVYCDDGYNGDREAALAKLREAVK